MFDLNNADIVFASANPPWRTKIYLPKLYINHDKQAGHSIFAHSRPDKIGTPRLLPLYIRNILNGISAKKSAQILCPSFLFEFVSNVHFRLVGHDEQQD